MHAKNREKLISKIKEILKEENKLEFVYKNLGVKFKEENDELFVSKITYVSLKWKEWESVNSVSIAVLGMIESDLRKIIRKSKKAELKRLKKEQKNK